MLWLLLTCVCFVTAADLRLGIIGTDTSHATAFTRVLNDPKDANHVPGAHIVAAWRGGSPDIEESAKRVDQFAAELKEKWGVKIVESIAQLCPDVDGLLLESVDGRPHLQQFQQAAECGKPVFIDKPLASTLADAREIARLARERGIPWFSASSLRYSPIAELRGPDVVSAMMWAPGPLEPHHQLDLSWYGIHGIEMLYTVLGMGCVEVSRVSSPDSDVITGKWSDGRLGTVHLQRPYGRYGGVAYLKNQKLNAMPDISFSYPALVREIVKFMETKTPPVSNAETLEIFAFMDAAQRSAAQGGALVKLEGR
ncbi:MAG TPA: Gfo/Idh/MocA family oxidoreductase [Bryobacteraceae bacterium]|nr:Gfo/Idh/MocA family oxidoreductase [Bryobacteraceae bacterium]